MKKNKALSIIFELLKPFKIALFIMSSAAMVWAIDLSLRPYILKIILDRISDSSQDNVFEYVKYPMLLYFCMMLLYPIMVRLYGYFVEIKMIPILRRNIVIKSIDSLLGQSYSYYQNNFGGSLINKVNDLVNSIPELVQLVLDSFLSYGLALIIAMYTLSLVSSVFLVVMLGWSIFCIIGVYFWSQRLSRLADDWSELRSRITGEMVDRLANILSIHLFAKKRAESESLSRDFDQAVQTEQKLQWQYFWTSSFYSISFIVIQSFSLYFLLKGRQEGWVSVGDFVVVLSINVAIVDFLSQLTKDFSNFSKLWGKITQAIRIIQEVPEIQDKKGAAELKVKNGRITFDKVNFNYAGMNGFFANKSIEIAPRQKIGLVGFSGSGKSTFANLILRLYDVTSGRILIDGQNICDVTQASLRSNIGVIPQDPFLFNRSLLENIRYARIGASDDEVKQAAQAACAHEFISKLPQGYQTLAGERGSKFSGGQRQRISIARAFLKNAPILILDEATSQLDSITEDAIQTSLDLLMKNKTSIVIAHRLSTILSMDRILVFQEGKIVEDGAHQELLKLNGFYKMLWEKQEKGMLPIAKKDPKSSTIRVSSVKKIKT